MGQYWSSGVIGSSDVIDYQIDMAALGRPFTLGMLYDCRRDSAIPGFALWNAEDLERAKRTTSQVNTEFDIVASESMEDKTSSLNVGMSLKASFLAGLVEIGGSAKYLTDYKKSKNHARVTLNYKATTTFEQLSLHDIGRDDVKLNVFDSGIATHVVTGIVYGAQAFFVFDHQVSDEENMTEIEGNLRVKINTIPSMSGNAKGSAQMKDTDRAKADQFSCKFHGDFALDTAPVSFNDAIAVYQSLPGLLKEGKPVPVQVWLLPLKVLDSRAARLVREISNGLVDQAQSVLEDFSELELRCNDALKKTVAQKFPQIKNKLLAFKRHCNGYKLDFQKMLANKLPSLRAGGEEESVLAEILKRRHTSPFNHEDLSEWMRCKEREINTIQSLTDMMKNTKVVSCERDRDQIILSPETEHVVCFAFTSLQMAEPYMSTLSNYLKETSNQVKSEVPPLHNLDAGKDQWYFSKDVYQSLRQKATLFNDFSEANEENKKIHFLITAIPHESQKGACVYLYTDGVEVNDNFEPPSKPGKAEITSLSRETLGCTTVALKMCPPRFGAKDISHYSIEYRAFEYRVLNKIKQGIAEQGDWRQQTASKADKVTVSIFNLRNLPGTNSEFQFRYRAVCPVGRGPASEVLDYTPLYCM